MSRLSIEPSLTSAAPARTHAPASGTVVVALTEELSLLEALGGAVGDGAGFTAAPSMERFADLLLVSGADLALIDCALLDAAPGAFFSRIHNQFPKLTLLAIGDSSQQQQLAPLLGDGTILRFAHRPLSAQRLRLFLETARRHSEGAQALAGLAASSETSKSSNETTSTRYQPPRAPRSSLRPWALILMLGVLLAGALWWWRPSGQSSESPAPAPEAAAPSTVVADQTTRDTSPAPAADAVATPAVDTEVQHWVELANERMQEGALIAPSDDNAQSYISAAAARAPQNPAVRAAAHELGERLISATRSALATGDLTSAQRWLAAAKDYRVGASTITQLESELAQARTATAPATNSANAPGASVAPPTAPITSAPGSAPGDTP